MPYCFKVDRTHQILLLEVHGRVVDEDLRKGYAEAGKVAATLSIAGAIVDFSQVTTDETSVDLIRELAERDPIIPDPILRVVVAPQDFVYGRMRMFQMIGEEKREMVRLVRRTDEAYDMLGLKTPVFEPLEPNRSRDA